MALTCGVDIGGTKIAGAVVDEDGTVLARARVASDATSPDAIESSIADLVEELTATHEIAAIGVGAAGYIDRDRSTVLFAPNISWRDEPLRADLERALDHPVVVENDANAAAWGEFRFGAAAAVDHSLMVTLGTGVGGGVVADSVLQRGGFGIGGEIGHLRVMPGGRLCGCGARGCLEQYGSGTALVQSARRAVGAGGPQAAALLELAEGDPDRLTGQMVTQAAAEGDRLAIEQIRILGAWVGEALSSLAAILDPEMVVIGGGVSEAGDLLLDPIREAYRATLPGAGHRPELRVEAATLGNDAGMIGAADLARDLLAESS